MSATTDLRHRLEVLRGRLDDVPPVYRPHVAATLDRLGDLIDAMTEPHHPQTGDTP